MINYSWLITNLELQKQDDILQNVVITINWTLTASEGNYKTRESGTTNLRSPDPNHFIDYQNLTNDILVSWIAANENVPSLKQQLADKIAEMQSEPTVFVNFPGAVQTPAQEDSLLQHKTYIKQRLQASYNSELMLGITSVTLGKQHTYRCSPAEQGYVQLATQFGGSIMCELDGVWLYRPHTIDQAKQVLQKMWQHIQSLQQQLQTLHALVDAATTEDEVNAVVW